MGWGVCSIQKKNSTFAAEMNHVFELIMQQTASAVIAWAVSFCLIYMRARAIIFETNLRFTAFSFALNTFTPFCNFVCLK